MPGISCGRVFGCEDRRARGTSEARTAKARRLKRRCLPEGERPCGYQLPGSTATSPPSTESANRKNLPGLARRNPSRDLDAEMAVGAFLIGHFVTSGVLRGVTRVGRLRASRNCCNILRARPCHSGARVLSQALWEQKPVFGVHEGKGTSDMLNRLLNSISRILASWPAETANFQPVWRRRK